MARVVWPDEVVDQLDQIKAYIRLFDPSAADRITSRLVDLGNSLEHYPNRGRPSGPGVRQLTTVSPYVLSYMVAGEFAVILDIRHAARRPLD